MRLIFVCLLGLCSNMALAKFQYQLTPDQVAKDTYVFWGDLGFFTKKNGGAILNSGFIVTSKGVVVIDSGPSKRYGEAMLAAIKTVTDKPVSHVILSHHHPDHSFGNQAFLAANPKVKIIALNTTTELLEHEGDAFLDNLYRLVGNGMISTELLLPNQALNIDIGKSIALDIGDHKLQLHAFEGHTKADLVVLDTSTGVLFAGDLVFSQRAPATPHADIAQWQATLEQLAKLPINLLIPGHGPAVGKLNKEADLTSLALQNSALIRETSEYLSWLNNTVKQAVDEGGAMVEVMRLPIPEKYQSWGSMPHEYERSVEHLYPEFEQQALMLLEQ